MENNELTMLERGIVSVAGLDANDFLQNIITNNINAVVSNNSRYSAILTPQGKFLYDFFVIKSKNGYYLDCESDLTKEIIDFLMKYKLRSKITIEDLSTKYKVAAISSQTSTKIMEQDLAEESFIYTDSRLASLGSRIISTKEKLDEKIKKLNLKIKKENDYNLKCFEIGVPTKNLKKLQGKLFGIEMNLDDLKGIDFEKGCYIGQENTSRIKLRNKLRRRILPAKLLSGKISEGDIINFGDEEVGKVMIDKPYTFALIKVVDPFLEKFINSELVCKNGKLRIFKPEWLKI